MTQLLFSERLEKWLEDGPDGLQVMEEAPEDIKEEIQERFNSLEEGYFIDETGELGLDDMTEEEKKEIDRQLRDEGLETYDI